MNAHYLVLGKTGQVARALAAVLSDKAHCAGREELDFNHKHFQSQLNNLLDAHSWRAVINAVAYTQVDKAEQEGRVEALRVNAQAVAILAKACAVRNLPLIHYSTDYVFDGSTDSAWIETDIPNPLNHYGKSKYESEQAIIAAGGPHFIFRTSWVYDAWGKNFFNTMLRLFTEKTSVNIIADQYGSPTYAPHLAKATVNILETALLWPQFPSGIYHLCGTGATSWHGFASTIFTLARSGEFVQNSDIICNQLQPIPTSKYPTLAKRPLNSRLDCGKAKRTFGIALAPWEEGVLQCFEEKYARNRLSATGVESHPAETAGR